MDGTLERGWALFRQGRHDAAIEFAQRVLAQDLDNANAYGLLALCRLAKKEYLAAAQAADQGVARAPEESFGHYVRAIVQRERNDSKAALESIGTAIEFDPEAPSLRHLEGELLLDLDRTQEALEAADRTLELDATHQGGLNLRARVLARLGRTDAAQSTLNTALAEDPEDPDHHAAQGWLALQSKQYDKARFHFSEALRRDPHHEWARSGLVESLKAKHFLYRPLLAYLLWMSRLTAGQRWGLILGAFLLMRMGRRVTQDRPELVAWFLPVQIVYTALVVGSWLGVPLFNLVLAADRFGRRALLPIELRVACGVGAAIAIGGILAVSSWWFGATLAMIGLAVGVLTFPIASIPDGQPGWPRRTLTLYAAANLALLGCASWCLLVGGPEQRKLGSGLLAVSVLVSFVATWVGPILGSVRPAR